MSKISDWLDARNPEPEPTSLRELAAELNRSPETLIQQFREAGVSLSSEIDMVGSADKERLLDFLRQRHLSDQPRPTLKLALADPHWPAIQSVVANENGAERAMLEDFAYLVVWGCPIPENLQAAANLVFAKAVLQGRLPPSRVGRPAQERTSDVGESVAQKYWDLRDSGVGYREAIEQLEQQFHKGERHLMRLVHSHSQSVGADLKAREDRRRWAKWMVELHEGAEGSAPNGYLDWALKVIESGTPPDFTIEDALDHLNEQLSLIKPTVG